MREAPNWPELLQRSQHERRLIHIHLIGIGGAGLSAIAVVLAELGYTVSGSDRQESSALPELQARGVTVFVGHRAEQIQGADLVLISSAVPVDNVELIAAQQADIPVVKREAFLGVLLRSYKLIAVAGTHGKTTTTGMIATILLEAGLKPGYIVGATVPSLHGNASAGGGRYFVIEADEYDRMFLGLQPDIAIVTNAEWDHPDCYPTPASYQDAFVDFVGKIQPNGFLISCNDDPNVSLFSPSSDVSNISYALHSQASWRATDVQVNSQAETEANVFHQGEFVGRLRLNVVGAHNVANALAAIAAADAVGINPAEAINYLAKYSGAARRFEFKGEAANIRVYDDYAHHPTEIRATLSAARLLFPTRRIWAVFQPHTYSRTQALWAEFASAFDDVDFLFVLDIFAAREVPAREVSGINLAAAIRNPETRFVSSLADAIDLIVNSIQAGDVLFTLGAGDGYRVGEQVLNLLSKKELHV